MASEDVAPYTDPDGYPSWQPNAEVREMDAWSRRYRAALAHAETMSRLREQAEQIEHWFSLQTAEAWLVVHRMLDERDFPDLDDNPNRPYRPEV